MCVCVCVCVCVQSCDFVGPSQQQKAVCMLACVKDFVLFDMNIHTLVCVCVCVCVCARACVCAAQTNNTQKKKTSVTTVLRSVPAQNMCSIYFPFLLTFQIHVSVCACLPCMYSPVIFVCVSCCVITPRACREHTYRQFDRLFRKQPTLGGLSAPRLEFLPR